MKQECISIKIVVRGKSEAHRELAIEAAVEDILAGSTTGGDSEDDSGYYFVVTTDVPKSEWPA